MPLLGVKGCCVRSAGVRDEGVLCERCRCEGIGGAV